MDLWLVRTSENWIAGPYPKEQVCQMLLEGKLNLQDEICPENGYWIFIHERAEVREKLGVDVPRDAGGTDVEVTETGIEEDLTDPNLPDLSASEASPMESTTMVLRAQPKKKSKRIESSYVSPRVEIVGQIEDPVFWRGFAWVLVGAAGILVTAVIWLLKRS